MKALVDNGASNNFVEVKEAKRLGVAYKKQGWLKAVNSEAKSIFGVTQSRGTPWRMDKPG